VVCIEVSDHQRMEDLAGRGLKAFSCTVLNETDIYENYWEVIQLKLK